MIKKLCTTTFVLSWLIGLLTIGLMFLQNAMLCITGIDIAFGITTAILTWLLIPFGLWGITKGWILPTRNKNEGGS